MIITLFEDRAPCKTLARSVRITKFGIIPYFAIMLPGWKVIEHWPSIVYIKTLVLVSCRAVSYWALYRDKELGNHILDIYSCTSRLYLPNYGSTGDQKGQS